MPIYDYQCKKCDTKVTIYRSVSEMENLPTEEEYAFAPCRGPLPTSGRNEHLWEKKLGSFMLTRGSGWRGKKGSW